LVPVLWGLIASFLGMFGGVLALSMLLVRLPVEEVYYYPSVWGVLSAIAVPLLGILASVVIYVILLIMAEGMTIEMVKEASAGRQASLSDAWEYTKERMGNLLIAALLVAIVAALLLFISVLLMVVSGVAPAALFFIIIGMILSFFLWFVPQAVMIQDAGAGASLGESFSFVKNNFADSFIVILVSVLIYAALSAIPVVGVILTIGVIPFIVALSTLLYLDRA
jgi:hypothetical protein